MYKRRTSKTINVETTNHTKENVLYVGCILNTARKDDLLEYFSRFGKVVEVSLEMRSPTKNKGFGYVRVEQLDVYSTILSSKHSLFGSILQVEKYLSENTLSSKHHDLNNRRLIVYKLKYHEWNLENFKSLMNKFGDVERILLNKPQTGNVQLISGIVTFKSPSPVKRVLADKLLASRGIRVKLLNQTTSPVSNVINNTNKLHVPGPGSNATLPLNSARSNRRNNLKDQVSTLKKRTAAPIGLNKAIKRSGLVNDNQKNANNICLRILPEVAPWDFEPKNFGKSVFLTKTTIRYGCY